MEALKTATNLTEERGKYTVNVSSFEDLMIFEGFQSEHPSNPMQFDVPNRHELRGKFLFDDYTNKYHLILFFQSILM